MQKEGIPYGRSARRTHEVFDDHLRLRLEGRLEGDLARNYAEDVVLLTMNWNACGDQAIRTSGWLTTFLALNSNSLQISDRFALLIWRAAFSSMPSRVPTHSLSTAA